LWAEGGRKRPPSFIFVLKSNGYKHPEIRLKKFEFSLKSASTNVAENYPNTHLSNQRSSAFSTLPTNASRSLLLTKAGTNSNLREKNAHGGLHAETRGFILCLRGEHLTQPTFMTENSRRKRMHAL